MGPSGMRLSVGTDFHYSSALLRKQFTKVGLQGVRLHRRFKLKGRRRNYIGRCDLVNVPLEILDVRSLGRFYREGNAFSASYFV